MRNKLYLGILLLAVCVAGMTQIPNIGGTIVDGAANLSSMILGWNHDTGFSRDSAGVVDCGNGTAGNKSCTLNLTNINIPNGGLLTTGTGSAYVQVGNSGVVVTGPSSAQVSLQTNGTIGATGAIQAASFGTVSNCASSASPAVCGSAAAGSVQIPTGTTSETLTVNTTAVTANSQIVFYPDDSLGTRLSTTCNSTLATLVGGSFISARTPGTSFTITFNGTILTNGVCGSYTIIN